MTELERQHTAWKAARDRLYNPKLKPAQIAEGIRVAFVPAPVGSIEDQALARMGPHVVRRVLWETFFFTGVTPAEILGFSRRGRIVAARQHAMARVYAETQMSMPAVGRAFHRDHTTVLHALRKTDWYVPSPQLKAAAFIGPKRPRPPRLPRSGGRAASKFTPDVVVALRQSFEAGEKTIRSMALELNMARSTINNMLRRKTWKHVP